MISTADPLFDIVRRVLSRCCGKSNAMTLAAIAEESGSSRRAVEHVIEHNLDALPFALVACADGLYIPDPDDDPNQYIHSLHSRHRRLQVREATTRRKLKLAGWREENGRFVRPVQITQTDLFENVKVRVSE